MTTGQKITERRKQLGLSQEALGEKMGVTRQAISKWESDAALPDVEKLVNLSRLFDVTVGWLLGTEPEPQKTEDSGELSEKQLLMIEEIVRRYTTGAQPGEVSATEELIQLPAGEARKKSSPWPKRLLALAFAVLMIWCVYLSGRLSILQDSVWSMNNNLTEQIGDLTDQVGTQQVRVSGVVNQLEEMTEDNNSLLTSKKLELVSADFDAQTAVVELTVMPKYPDFVQGVSDFLFSANSPLSGDQFIRAVDEKGAPTGSWDGTTYKTTLTLPFEDEYSYFLTLPVEDGSAQICIAESGKASSVDVCNLKSMFDISVSADFYKFGVDQSGVMLDYSFWLSVITWNDAYTLEDLDLEKNQVVEELMVNNQVVEEYQITQELVEELTESEHSVISKSIKLPDYLKEENDVLSFRFTVTLEDGRSGTAYETAGLRYENGGYNYVSIDDNGEVFWE